MHACSKRSHFFCRRIFVHDSNLLKSITIELDWKRIIFKDKTKIKRFAPMEGLGVELQMNKLIYHDTKFFQ